jgi:hypothetical protein
MPSLRRTESFGEVPTKGFGIVRFGASLTQPPFQATRGLLAPYVRRCSRNCVVLFIFCSFENVAKF